ncbi:MAG: hypothetical protein ACHQIO_14410 [Nevskiales bacterium]
MMDLYANLIAAGLGYVQTWFGPVLGTAIFTLVKTLVLIVLIVAPHPCSKPAMPSRRSRG